MGVGETLQMIMANCMVKVMGKETKETCGTEQLYGGVEAGIDGGIHVMRLLWAHHAQEED